MILPAWIVGFSLLGVGSLAHDAGHPIGAAMLSTVLIYASPAQLILYTALAGGGAVLTAALAVAFSAIRLMPMTIAIMPFLRRPRQSLIEQILLAHPVAATVWLENMRHLPGMEPDARVAFFTGFSVVCVGLSTIMTGIGFVLVSALPPALAAGLLGITPIYFTVAMVAGARRTGEWLAIGFGLALAPLAALTLGPDFDLISAGLVGGTIAYAIDRAVRSRRAAAALP